MDLIQLVFPQLKDNSFIPMDDTNDCNDWYNTFVDKTKHIKYNSVVYFCNKQIDTYDFVFNGIQYTNGFYNDIFTIMDSCKCAGEYTLCGVGLWCCLQCSLMFC